ncbi:NTP pyrophosphohydrolase [Buchananella felis]|uniref:NTP pyrophosphohydrolase n=1 Tax=Buchananella felis TaxID=3231492 RepID=UPI0035283B79
MKHFEAVYTGEEGTIGSYSLQYTPKSFADDFELDLKSRHFNGKRIFAMLVWAGPDDMEPDEVRKNSYHRDNYMQCAGSNAAMTVEVRVTHPDRSFEHYVVAREPVRDPNAWTTITWDNGSPELCVWRLHQEEVFTGEQAAKVFRDYIEHDQLPPKELLRRTEN